jgi:hypothetical protein
MLRQVWKCNKGDVLSIRSEKKKFENKSQKKKKKTLNLTLLLLHQAQLLLQIRVHAREAQQQNAASGNVERGRSVPDCGNHVHSL